MSYSNLRKVIYKMLDNSYSDGTTPYVKFLTIDTSTVKEYDIECNFDLDDAEIKNSKNEGLQAYFTLNLINGTTSGEAGEIRSTEYLFDSAVSNLSYENDSGLLVSEGKYEIYKEIVNDTETVDGKEINNEKIKFYIGFKKGEVPATIKKFKLKIAVNYGIVDDLDHVSVKTISEDLKIATIDFTKVTSAVTTHPILAQKDGVNKDNTYYLTATDRNEEVADGKAYALDSLQLSRITTEDETDQTQTSTINLKLKAVNSNCQMEFDEKQKTFRIFWE